MSWLIAAAGVWTLAAGFFCVLARSAGMADAGHTRMAALDLVSDGELFVELVGDAGLTERRSGQADRRAASRPWNSSTPGRRSEDQRRRADEAERRLRRSRGRLGRDEAGTA